LCVDQEFIVKKFSYLAIVIWGAAMCAPFAAVAHAAATDPAAAVPPVIYQSVFNQSPMGVETKSVDWKKANADVGQFKRGHVDILKWEESQLKDKPAAKPSQSAAPTPHKH
jgi:hypothetical protein